MGTFVRTAIAGIRLFYQPESYCGFTPHDSTKRLREPPPFAVTIIPLEVMRGASATCRLLIELPYLFYWEGFEDSCDDFEPCAPVCDE
jgi:hypothetical protein